jgi:toxin-antitoxin system PIN domain toxin
MRLFDVNVLIYATRKQAVDHERYQAWLTKVIDGPAAFGVAELVLSAYLRIVTNPRILSKPLAISDALHIVDGIRSKPNCVVIRPDIRHWGIFSDLCVKANAKGNLVADAYLAALAIESGSDWYSTDRDFARFPGFRWRHPLDE